MKKKIILVSMVAFYCFACTNSTNDKAATNADTLKTEAAPPPVETMKNGITREDYEKGLALIGSSDCLTCHKVSEKLVGPAYKDVANRYTANPDTINMLASKILSGGSGRWGEVPMTAHPNLSKEDAVQMVKYVLAIE